MSKATGRQSFHVHTETKDFCESFSFNNSDTRADIMRRAAGALKHAKEVGGTLVGPYDFDFRTCQHRIEGFKALGQADPGIGHDDGKPDPYELPHVDPSRTIYAKEGSVHWHLHKDDGECHSFDTEDEALAFRAERHHRGYANAILVGPVNFPAVACSYYNDYQIWAKAQRDAKKKAVGSEHHA